MNSNEEAIDCMARTIFTEIDPLSGVSWDNLSDSEKNRWLVATARGWEAYWVQREFLENRPR